jgi:hypothetical protein
MRATLSWYVGWRALFGRDDPAAAAARLQPHGKLLLGHSLFYNSRATSKCLATSFSTFFFLVGLQFMTNSKPVSFSVSYPNNYSHKIPMLFYTHIAFFNPAFQRSCESECQTDRGNGRQNPEHSKYQKFLYGMNGWLNCLCLRGHLHSLSIAVFDRFACCSSAASGWRKLCLLDIVPHCLWGRVWSN